MRGSLRSGRKPQRGEELGSGVRSMSDDAAWHNRNKTHNQTRLVMHQGTRKFGCR